MNISYDHLDEHLYLYETHYGHLDEHSDYMNI